jgi:hypothetical protein
MTLDYRSPHQTRTPPRYGDETQGRFTVNNGPLPLPPGAFGVEWLMGHVVDVIAAGPIYDGKLSPVWAQMVRLYAQHLGVIPARAPTARDERTPRRRALEKDLRALIPAIADLIEAQDAEDEEDEPCETAPDPDLEPEPDPPPPSPEDQAAASAYELAPLSRLTDDGVLLEALGPRPRPETLHRVLKLALDACAHRARILRGPLAEISPQAAGLADRLRRRGINWFRADLDLPPEGDRDTLAELHQDLFETPQQAYRRLYYPPNGSPPN